VEKEKPIAVQQDVSDIPTATSDDAELPPRRFTLGALFRSRGGWALADQGIVSLGNFATGIILVRSLPKVEYGVYFLIFGVLQFLNSLHQSLITYPLSVRGATSDHERLRSLAGSALLFTLLLAMPLSLGVVIIVGVENRPSLLPWALAAMFLWQFQETLRRAIMSHLRHREALPGDAISYISQVGILFLLASRGTLTLETTFAVIAGTSLLALVLHGLQLRPAMGGRDHVPSRMRDHWSLGRWVLLTNLITIVTVQAMPWTLAYFHGEDQVAEFGVLAQIMGLSNPIIISIAGLVVPAVAAAAQRGVAASRHVALVYGLQGAALLLPYYVAVMLVPNLALRLLTKNNPDYAGLTTPLRLFVIAYMLVFPAQVMQALLNGLGRTRSTFIAQCAFSITTLVVSLPLAAVYGLTGAVWSGMLPAIAYVVVSAWMLRRVTDLPHARIAGFDMLPIKAAPEGVTA
jgi:O-antigen/teichoic acid export membrane protein